MSVCSPEQNLRSASGFTITHYLMQSLEIFYDEFNCVRFGNFLVREPNTQQRLSRLSRHILSMTNSLDYAFRVSGYSQLFPKLHVFFVLPHGGTIGRTSARLVFVFSLRCPRPQDEPAANQRDANDDQPDAKSSHLLRQNVF